MFSLS